MSSGSGPDDVARGAVAPWLPVGMQVIAPYLEDRTAIDAARHLSRVTGGYVAPAI